MFKRILAVCICAMAPSLVLAAAEQDPVVVGNQELQVKAAELRTITQGLLKTGQIPADQLSAAHVENAAKDYLLYKVLAAQAQEQGLDQAPDVRKLLDMNQQRILGNIYLVDYLDNLELPDFASAAEENYKVNKQQFARPATVRAQHILIAFDGDEEQSKKQAQAVREKVVAGQQSFAELAKEYSTDPSAQNNGGDLGFFDNKTMVAEFTEAAFALAEEAVSEPVKTQFGWHIIQVLEKKPASVRPFAEVKENLINAAEQTFKRNARNKKIAELVDTQSLTVDEELLEKIANELLSE